MDKLTRNILIGGVVITLIGGTSILYRAIKKQNSNSNTNNEGSDTNISTPTDVNTIKIGDKLYPSGSSVNIRNYAVVDSGYTTNIIKENHTGLIGTVEAVETGKEDFMTWYKVKLAQPFSAWYYDDRNKIPSYWTFNYGYVRGDVVKKG